MADTKKHSASIPSLTDERYERTDARLSAVIIVSLLLVAAAVMSAVAVWYYYAFALTKLKHRQSQMAAAPGKPAEIPANMPKLQIDSSIDLTLFKAEQQKQLESYGWVSREAQVVRIPIERAIELTVERKLPSASANVTTGTAPDNGADLPQDSSSGRTSWDLTVSPKPRVIAPHESTTGTATDKPAHPQQHSHLTGTLTDSHDSSYRHYPCLRGGPDLIARSRTLPV